MSSASFLATWLQPRQLTTNLCGGSCSMMASSRWAMTWRSTSPGGALMVLSAHLCGSSGSCTTNTRPRAPVARVRVRSHVWLTRPPHGFQGPGRAATARRWHPPCAICSLIWYFLPLISATLPDCPMASAVTVARTEAAVAAVESQATTRAVHAQSIAAWNPCGELCAHPVGHGLAGALFQQETNRDTKSSKAKLAHFAHKPAFRVTLIDKHGVRSLESLTALY